MIDVVFLLLVFWMLVSSLIETSAIRLDAPDTRRAGGPSENSLLVRIAGNDALALNGTEMSLEELTSRIRQRVVIDPEQRVLVQPERGVALQRLVTVLDRLTEVGATNLTLVRD